jgi:prepilin-type N-terminal cleavage/methylation domain-containing protein
MSARPSTRLPARRGFTLVEMLVAMTLLSVVMGAMISVVVRVQRDYVRQRSRSDAMASLRSSELMLGRVFRTAGADPQRIGVVGIVAAPSGAGSVRVRADFNPADGDVADPLEDVTFDLSGGDMRVRWQAGGATTPLTRPVQSLAFEYFRRDGTQITTLANADSARRVRITITAPIRRSDGTTGALQSVTWAYVRNP